MSRRQFGFLVGFLAGWLLWAAGFWVTLGVAFLGTLGYLAARVMEGDVELPEIVERVTGGRR